MSAVAAVVLLSVLGCGLLIAGAYVLAGIGVALLTAGAVSIVAAVALGVAVSKASSGIAPNG